MFRWPEYVPRGALCAWEGSSQADSHGSNSSGMAGGGNDAAGNASGDGGRDEGDRARAAAEVGVGAFGAGSLGGNFAALPADAPVVDMSPQMARQLGIQTPEEIAADEEAAKVARGFVDLMLMAIPGAGLLNWVAEKAISKGFTVSNDAPQAANQGGMLAGLYGPPGQPAGLPNSAAALNSMPDLPGAVPDSDGSGAFLPSAFPALGLYGTSDPVPAAAGSVAALGPSNGAETAADAPTAEKSDFLPLLAISAGLMVALAL